MTSLCDPYEIEFQQKMNTYSEDLWKHLELVPTLAPDLGDSILTYLLELACQCQNIRNIELGRTALVELPRVWVLKHVERIAEPLLQSNDEWEYRRLLEVYELLDKKLAYRLANRGLSSHNPEVKETAKQYYEDMGIHHETPRKDTEGF